MNIFMVSVFLAAVTVCSSHRQTSRGRTSFVTRAQIGRICNEIVTLKEEIGTLKEENGNQQKEIVSLKEEIGQQKEELSQQKEEIGQQEDEISQLKHKNIEHQNRIEDLEQSSTGAGKKLSRFARKPHIGVSTQVHHKSIDGGYSLGI